MSDNVIYHFHISLVYKNLSYEVNVNFVNNSLIVNYLYDSPSECTEYGGSGGYPSNCHPSSKRLNSTLCIKRLGFHI